jgi:hypothetical protein
LSDPRCSLMQSLFARPLGHKKPHVQLRIPIDGSCHFDRKGHKFEMTSSVQIWRFVLAALTTLAIIFAWPPLGSNSMSSHLLAAVSSSPSHHKCAEERGAQRVLHGTRDEDCRASVTGCCMTTHCLPGLLVGPHEMATLAAIDETATAAAVRGLGSDPGVILPPPRCPWL